MPPCLPPSLPQVGYTAVRGPVTLGTRCPDATERFSRCSSCDLRIYPFRFARSARMSIPASAAGAPTSAGDCGHGEDGEGEGGEKAFHRQFPFG